MTLKNLKNKLKDDKLDLSFQDLKEVPVKAIAAVKQATYLDLSSNQLVSLPSTFVTLKQVVKLDLSRNMLTEIPENFGELTQLKYLDLYANQISRLPLSLSELKNLRWLDLKENPLTPAVASVAGPCSNLSECQACARNIVSYLSNVKLTINEEKLRRLNNATVEAEADPSVSKKGPKKKKKKTVEKDGKQNIDKNGSNSLSETSKNEVEASKSTQSHKYSAKKRASKGKTRRSFLHSVAWIFLFILVLASMVVVLPMYSEQSETFVNYIENNTGVPLKAFQKHSVDTFHHSVRTATEWTKNICDNLYHTYENFKMNTNIASE
ncbi:leucine-rich repeat-containing protein 59 [Calliopsis andreniformis]|uniref:leucine-rich repeat-containing protein 59 n=1 Tax=Calliopsis andreniformis TaxID=337506 RepID=UPI003FCC8AAD